MIGRESDRVIFVLGGGVLVVVKIGGLRASWVFHLETNTIPATTVRVRILKSKLKIHSWQRFLPLLHYSHGVMRLSVLLLWFYSSLL